LNTKNTLLYVTLALLCSFQSYSQSKSIHPLEVRKQMQRVADWQIVHFKDTFSNRKKPHHIADWTNGALYIGMGKFAKMAKDDRYWKWLKDIGNQQNWKLHRRKYMADDHVVGQMYVELFRKYGDSSYIRTLDLV